jgi:3-oxoacyl-[acyl-carrier protein] reductase
MPAIDLTGRTALVTGGNSGIGRAIVLALAGAGADVALTYHSHGGSETSDAVAALGRKGIAVEMDGTGSLEVRRAVDEAARYLDGHIDILVNNAGGLIARLPVPDMSDEFWHAVIDLNLSSVFYVTRAALAFMTTGWGRIVNVASIAAHNGSGPGTSAYTAAKGGVVAMTRALAKELAPRGITVNAVSPGLILETGIHEKLTPPESMRATIAQTPLQRGGVPGDVAGAVLFLASDLASFVTGDTIGVNGGTWFR